MSALEIIIIIILALAAIRGVMTGFLRQIIIFVGYYLLALLLFNIIGTNNFDLPFSTNSNSLFYNLLTLIIMIIGGVLLIKFAAKIINALFNKIPVLGTMNRILGMILCVFLVMFIIGSFIIILLNLGVQPDSLELTNNGITNFCYRLFVTLIDIF
ncbi:MAG: CvpA family protein [Arcobacteraceae bacterium]|nr:CvpA family protein [Arcobacteraceae bacterium]